MGGSVSNIYFIIEWLTYMDDSVSVVIPYYNDSPRIEKCLDSICSQTGQAIEVIIVDDCSKDSALLLKIIDKFKNKINIRYLRMMKIKMGHIPET